MQAAHDTQVLRSRRYMSKSQRACDFCRERKSACRLDQGPPCQLCSFYKRDCTFHSASDRGKKRAISNGDSEGLPAPSTRLAALATPLRAEEPVALASSDSLAPTASGSQSIQSAYQPPCDGNNFDVGSLPTVIDERDSGDALALDFTTTFDSFSDLFRSPGQLMQGIQDFGQSEGPVVHEGRLCGLTGDMDPYLLRLYRFDGSAGLPFKKLTIRSIDADHFPVQFVQSNSNVDIDTQQKEALFREELECIVPPIVGERLISLFHQFIAPQLPLLPTECWLTPSTSPPPLLAAIYYVAHNFTTFDDYLCIQIVYDPPPLVSLWDFVMRYVHEKDRHPSISLLQAMLILIASPSQDLLMPDPEQRQSLLSDANSIAQALGLYHDAAQWPISPSDRRLRKRLSWTLRFLDSWNSAVSGRQGFISDDNWLVDDLRPEDFSNTEVEPGIAALAVEMAKLTDILREVIRRLFSLKAVQNLSLDFRQTMRTAQPLMEKLTEWQTQFHAAKYDARTDEVDNTAPLQLAHHYTRVLIIRSIYRPFCTFNSTVSFSTSDAKASEIEAYAHYRVAAKSAAQKFTEFTRGISDSQIRAFWPFWCTGAWATMGNLWLLLHSTATSSTERDECRTGLDQSRHLLRLRATSFPMLQFALLRVNSVFWKGLDDVIDPARS